MRRGTVAVAGMSIVLASCGGGAAIEPGPTTTAAPVTSSAMTSPTTSASTGPATPAPRRPAVVAIVSGRGDDGSLEIGVWFSDDPMDLPDYRLIVGVDSDDSYDTGSPEEALDGFLELVPQGATLFADGEEVATGSGGSIAESVSWTTAGRMLRVFFIGDLPDRSGTVWVLAETGGGFAPGAIAAVEFGGGCSARGSRLSLQVAGDVPDPGATCGYP